MLNKLKNDNRCIYALFFLNKGILFIVHIQVIMCIYNKCVIDIDKVDSV